MLTALAHNELVAAKYVCKDDGPFLCLECSAPLQLKKGTIKAHHFAHLVDAGCRYGYGEGERHRQLKEEICATLASSSQVRGLQQERRELRLVYPDISFWFRGKGWIAVEAQVTDISVDTIQRRVQTYTERGIALLWVLPWNETLINGDRYRPTRWAGLFGVPEYPKKEEMKSFFAILKKNERAKNDAILRYHVRSENATASARYSPRCSIIVCGL